MIGEAGEKDERCWQPTLFAIEMMLGYPGAVEPVSFGMKDLLPDKMVADGGISLIENPAEEAQSFRLEGGGHDIILDWLRKRRESAADGSCPEWRRSIRGYRRCAGE